MATPYPYGQPMPPPMPMAPVKFELKTESGLKYIMWANILYIVMTAISLVVALTTVAATINTESEIGAAVAAVASLGCIVSILAIIIFIFWIIGIVRMVGGRQEFGPDHAKSVMIGLVFLILMIAMYVAVIVTTAVMVGSTIGTAASGDFEGAFNNLTLSLILMIVFSILASVFGYIFEFFLVIKICLDRERIFLIVGVILGCILSTVGALMSFVINIGSSAIQNLVSGLGIAAWILIFIAYLRTYKNVRDRKIAPVAGYQPPGMPMPMGMAPPPQYGQPYPPPQYPPQQPPAYPPPQYGQPPQQPAPYPPPQYGQPPQQPAPYPPPQYGQPPEQKPPYPPQQY